MAAPRAKHSGYWLQADWVRGFPFQGWGLAVSRSRVLHNFFTATQHIIQRSRRLGVVLRVRRYAFAIYVERLEPATLAGAVNTETEIAVAE